MSKAPKSIGATRGASKARLFHPVDSVVAVLILAIIGWLYHLTTQFEEVADLFTQNIPPQLFPQILLVILAILAMIMPFEHILLTRAGKDIDKSRRNAIKPLTWLTMAVLIGLVSLIEILGMQLTMTAVCLVIPLLWGARKLRYVIPFAILFPLAVALLFNNILGVYFEPGIFNIRLT